MIDGVTGNDSLDDWRRAEDLLDYWTPIMLRAAIEADVLEAFGQTHRNFKDVAAETGTHAPTLSRVLRALAGRGVLRERNDGSYELTSIGQTFLAQHPHSARGMATFKNWEFHAWAEFEHTLFTGETAFVHHFGKRYFEWLAENPEAQARFDLQMERRISSLLSLAGPLIEQLPESGLLVDVGGGNGYFLASVLRSRPALSGILLDQPQVVAAAAGVFAEAGVDGRARAEAGDFFKAVPPGADVYTMLSVLHDWDDADALRILKCVREAMREGSRLLIGEAILRGPNERDTFKNIDLHMLVNLGGRERADEEWRILLGRAGFGSISITRSPTLGCITASDA